MQLRDVLAHAGIYGMFQRMVGAERERRLYVERYVRPRVGDRVLDVGCGPADILDALPSVTYVGLDMSKEYIQAARKRFGSRGEFEIGVVDASRVGKYHGFDLVLANGVLHHLPDEDALALLQLAKAALNPGGRLVTFDGCFVEAQSPVARFLLKKDRGAYVRNKQAYLKLAAAVFSDITATVTDDLLRVPYTHLVLECRREALSDKPGGL